MGRNVFRSASIVIGLILISSPVFAQQPPDAADLRAEIVKLRQAIDALEARLSALEGASPSAPSTPAGAPVASADVPVPAGAAGGGGPQGSLPVYGGSVGAAKVFNPDMAVIGNFLATAGKNEVSPSPAMELRETEATFQAVVDPYARADFFVAFGESGVDLEEGYITFPALPGGLLTRVGKMKAAFGKVNTLHSHVLPWADRPLVNTNLLGGEEGISAAGISVSRLIPNPVMFLEATGQVLRGDAGDVFASMKRSDLAYVGHLRGYHDITDSTNIDIGASYARGLNPSGVIGGDVLVGRFTTNLFGFDATYRWRPLARSIYHSFVGRTEIVWSRRDQPGGLQSSIGSFVSGDYQVGRRWFVGGRFDRAAKADDSSAIDTGQSATLTYWPSEFSQARAQYRRTKYAFGPTANELLFQLQFSIGAHGAHPF